MLRIFCRLLIIFFHKSSFRNNIRVSNSLDPDQARPYVGPDLGPNCLYRLSADDTRVDGKELIFSLILVFSGCAVILLVLACMSTGSTLHVG